VDAVLESRQGKVVGIAGITVMHGRSPAASRIAVAALARHLFDQCRS
jgi:hypothetical protein